MFDVYSFMCGLDPLWCKQNATVHSVVQKECVVCDSVCGVMSFDFPHFPDLSVISFVMYSTSSDNI